MLKKFLFFISLFIITNITFFLSAEIIPLKKPIQSKEVTEHKLLIDILKPLPKPTVEITIEKKRRKTVREKDSFK